MEEFVSTLPVTVIILRNEERMGIMRSRIKGAEKATGETLTFLDAHIEATDGWLEPLLTEVKYNKRAIVTPVIDMISDDNFGYVSSPSSYVSGFNFRIEYNI